MMMASAGGLEAGRRAERSFEGSRWFLGDQDFVEGDGPALRRASCRWRRRAVLRETLLKILCLGVGE